MTLRAWIAVGVGTVAHGLCSSSNRLARRPLLASGDAAAAAAHISNGQGWPIQVTTESHSQEEFARAKASVDRYSRTPLDFFKLWPDKSFLFSPSQRCVVAYEVANNVAIALGDPVGPADEIEPTMREFLQLCRASGWSAAFYQTLPDFLPLYRAFGLRKLKIGDDAMVDLRDFSLKDKLQRRVRQIEAMGIRILKYSPPLPNELIAQIHFK